jgi:hypothetical protein
VSGFVVNRGFNVMYVEVDESSRSGTRERALSLVVDRLGPFVDVPRPSLGSCLQTNVKYTGRYNRKSLEDCSCSVSRDVSKEKVVASESWTNCEIGSTRFGLQLTGASVRLWCSSPLETLSYGKLAAQGTSIAVLLGVIPHVLLEITEG